MSRMALGPRNSIEYLESLRLGMAYSKHSNHRKFVENRFYNAQDLFRFDLVGHYSCVNALDVSKDHAFLASGGDCMRVLMWDLDRAFCDPHYQAAEMKAKHESNIFSVAFAADRKALLSGGNDGTLIAHDPQTGEIIQSGELQWEIISSISVSPRHSSICLVSTCESFVNGFIGQSRGNAIYQFDLRCPWQNVGNPIIFIDGPPHCVQYNPVQPYCFATGDAENGLLQWDLRVLSKYEFRYQEDNPGDGGVMSLCWSSDGNRIASLPKLDSPRLFSTGLSSPIASFSAPGFANGCTLKSVTFAGPNEEYIVTGSDSFQVYMWRHDSVSRPESTTYETVDIKEASLTLTGHRSIVNQVRYCPRHYSLFSSGVEKMIKVWSVFSSPRSQGSLNGRDRAPQRKRREPSQLGSLPVIGQISNDSVEEDPMMLLFFDRLLYEDETGDTSPDESGSLPSCDISELFRRGLPPFNIYANSDSDSNSSMRSINNSISSNDTNDTDIHNSSDNDSSSSSNHSLIPNKRARTKVKQDDDDDNEDSDSNQINGSHNLRSSSQPGSSKYLFSCDRVDGKLSKVSRNSRKRKRQHRSTQSSKTLSMNCTSSSSSSENNDDIDSLSSLSSLSTESSSGNKNVKKTESSSSSVQKMTSKDDIEPPKNMRPSFSMTDNSDSSGGE